MSIILIFCLLLPVQPYHSNSCFQGCIACQINFIYIYCTQCDTNRLYDTLSGLCDCNDGTYDNGTTCIDCPSSCLTCISNSQCSSCSTDKSLNSKGACICQNGQSADANGICQISSGLGIVAIVGIAIATLSLIIFAAAGVIYLLYVRKYRPSQSQGQTHPDQNGVVAAPQMIKQVESGMQLIKGEWNFRQEMCSICLDGNSYIMTQCGHYFHQKCITSWLIKRRSCPNCNRTLTWRQLAKWCDACKKQLILPHKNSEQMANNINRIIERELIFENLCEECQTMEDKDDLLSIPGAQSVLQMP